MPLYSLNPSSLVKILSAKLLSGRSRSALLHKIVAELDLAECRAKNPQDLPGRWQSEHLEPIPLTHAKGAWRIVQTAQPDYLVRLRNNHVSGRGFATQEIWVRHDSAELYIEIGIQGIRIMVDGTWIAKIVRKLNSNKGRESYNISGWADQSAAHMSWLSNTLKTLLAPLRLTADTLNSRAPKASSSSSQFVTIRRTPGTLSNRGSRVIHLP